MLRQAKEDVVKEMRDSVGRAAGVLFLDFTGLTVAEADAFRQKVRAEGDGSVTYNVMKNTLMARAIAETPYAGAADFLKGTPTGVVIGFDDPVSAAKLTFEFLKTTDHLKIKGGIVDQKPISAQEAEALSKLPSRAELQASIVAQALSPGRNLAGQLKNPAGRVVGAIEALVDRLEEAGGQAA